MKFKIGDKVRVVKNLYGDRTPKPSNPFRHGTYTVIGVYPNDWEGRIYAIRKSTAKSGGVNAFGEELQLVNERKKPMATTLRQRVRAALRSKEDRALIAQGFTYESGALTKEGRKVVADLQFSGIDNKDLKAEVVKLATALQDENSKAKK